MGHCNLDATAWMLSTGTTVPLTFYVADLDVLCVRQSGDVDLGTGCLLQKTHVPALLANQSAD